ncbi:MAG: IS21 family transposase [Acidobacteriota bacterium]
MSERILNLMDIRELLLHMRAGSSYRQIQRDTGFDRRTVKRYRQWAQAQGLLEGELPSLEELQARLERSFQEKTPPQNESSVESYRSQVEAWVKQGVEVAAMRQRLLERGYTGSYAAVWRFVNTIKPGKQKDTTTRLETKPGEEAQVDFGYAGRMIDPASGKLRKAWAFVMTLSWSRHQYVEFVWDQKIETWLRCHRNAFEFFGCVPARVRIDNLRTAILRAVFDDPQVQYTYRECAEHYGFLIAPCRVATPEHKGKVEQGGVHYVCRNFLGGREATSLTQANRDALVWCNTTAGLRIHGTTKEKPLERFEQVEKACLKPLPESPYDLAVWKHVKVYRDCYVVFDNAFYSVPERLYPGQVWICGGSKQVRIFDEKQKLVATHERATKPGQRLTNLAHLPPEKVPGLTQDRDSLLAEAEQIGPALLAIVQSLLDDPVLYRIPTAGRLVRLKNRFGEARLEAACRRALSYDDPSYKTVKNVLKKGMEEEEVLLPVRLPPASAFARSADELVGELAETLPWN